MPIVVSRELNLTRGEMPVATKGGEGHLLWVATGAPAGAPRPSALWGRARVRGPGPDAGLWPVQGPRRISRPLASTVLPRGRRGLWPESKNVVAGPTTTDSSPCPRFLSDLPRRRTSSHSTSCRTQHPHRRGANQGFESLSLRQHALCGHSLRPRIGPEKPRNSAVFSRTAVHLGLTQDRRNLSLKPAFSPAVHFGHSVPNERG